MICYRKLRQSLNLTFRGNYDIIFLQKLREKKEKNNLVPRQLEASVHKSGVASCLGIGSSG